MSQALFQSIDLDELLETALHIALEEVGTEAGSILPEDPEKVELIFQYSIGEKPVPRGTPLPGIRVFPGQSSSQDSPGSPIRTRGVLRSLWQSAGAGCLPKFETASSQPRRSAPRRGALDSAPKT
jgi:hypothetical protein